MRSPCASAHIFATLLLCCFLAPRPSPDIHPALQLHRIHSMTAARSSWRHHADRRPSAMGHVCVPAPCISRPCTLVYLSISSTFILSHAHSSSHALSREWRRDRRRLVRRAQQAQHVPICPAPSPPASLHPLRTVSHTGGAALGWRWVAAASAASPPLPPMWRVLLLAALVATAVHVEGRSERHQSIYGAGCGACGGDTS